MKHKPEQNGVKNYLKFILPVVICISMIYTSCRKAENNPAPTKSTTTQTTDHATFAGQVAANLAHNLSGTYGGINVNKDIDSLSLANHSTNLAVNSAALCGLFTDSLVNFYYNQGDTVKWHMTGNETFSFNCQNNAPTGYTAYDSTYSVRTTANEVDDYITKQAYTIQALDTQHEFIGVSGDVYFWVASGSNPACHCNVGSWVANANYVVSNLKIDLHTTDVKSGTATFVATGFYGNISGTITYLGNFTANVTITGDSNVYQIDLTKYY